uniref:EGF-like domain-containing protein n=1 Tax=Plectus sambesii TaxID=2011161 RepID=A0A914V350_9BILA
MPVRQTSDDPSEITWSPSPSFNGTTNNINYTASAVGSCCLRHASLIVIDKVGLIGECDFDPPASSPCSGHGNVTCTCDFGYTGSNCESEIDFCSENVGGLQANTTLGSLCEPHGRCISTTAGAHCVCLPGFNGTVCEL